MSDVHYASRVPNKCKRTVVLTMHREKMKETQINTKTRLGKASSCDKERHSSTGQVPTSAPGIPPVLNVISAGKNRYTESQIKQ